MPAVPDLALVLPLPARQDLTVAGPRCYDCLTEDVTVKVTDQLGFDHWFCAADWAYWQGVREKVRDMFGDAARVLEQR